MTTEKVEINVPQEIVQFTVLYDKDALLKRNAMLVYPYVQDGTISHGRAAEMLGIPKIDLIQIYGKMGLPYFSMTEEELNEDLATLASLREKQVC